MDSYLVLYGIGRSKSNIKSLISFFKEIQPNINIIYVYIRIDNINNERSNEYGKISYDGFEHITENIFEYNIDSTKKIKLLDFASKYEDGHNDNYKSISNLINQLLMLDFAYSKIKHISKNDIVIAFRDDIKFDLLSKFLFKCYWKKIKKSDKLHVSAYSWHGGINDKFFIAKRDNAFKLLKRIVNLKNATRYYNHLNAEELIHYTSKLNEIKIKAIFCRVARLRISGKINWDPMRPSFTRIKDLFRVLKNL